MASAPMQIRFAIDRGGTFTDVAATLPSGRVRVLKLLSVDKAYHDAPREGIRRILEMETGEPHPADQPLATKHIHSIRMGTTVATNALLERQGEPMALVTSAGFCDVLHIGNQSRPRIFDLAITMPEVLYSDVVEAEERVVLDSDAGEFTAVTGERLTVETPLDEAALRRDLQAVYERGLRSLAIVFKHAYLFPGHEERAAEIAAEIGFTHVSCSSRVMRMVKMVPRGYTTCADAYLTPCIKRYLDDFASGFENRLKGVRVLFMRSDGGLTPMEEFSGSRAILSGPAGGVVGYGLTTFKKLTPQPVIGFDMGGTSTDVSRYAGKFEHTFENTTAGVTIQAPQLDITTVAAGGGSRLQFRAGLYCVGPESVGADPGPVCYRKGGALAVTDANLLLGRIRVESFPAIFGPGKDQPLDVEGTRQAFAALRESMAAEDPDTPPPSVEEVALGFLRVANEAMCRPIRAITQSKGFDTTTHALACFGGAGGQHACAIARNLGMGHIFVHRFSGILSAYGIAMADVVREEQAPCSAVYGNETEPQLRERLAALAGTDVAALQEQGFALEDISLEYFLNMRYKGTDCTMMTPPSSGDAFPAATAAEQQPEFKRSFEAMYEREFGFVLPGRDLLVDDVRVRATGRSRLPPMPPVAEASGPPTPQAQQPLFDEASLAWVECPVFALGDLCRGHTISGPALVTDATSTVVVEANCTASVTDEGHLHIVVGSGTPPPVTTELDKIQLSIFGHRFMAIAEEMGRALQRTSISTNIKERLDFSCALFDPSGGLVANAPHIPVHLGAMQEAVRFQIEHRRGDIRPGDVLVANHPAAGGSHLPDITVMTPVFHGSSPGGEPVFFVACRGHHADIGGITPGSMPPNSHALTEEGAAIISFKLVEGGVFQEEGITALLKKPAEYPGCSGTRNLEENLSDLKAQIAANQRGIVLVGELIGQYGLEVIQAYMQHIQDNAEQAVRELLREVGSRTLAQTGRSVLAAEDLLDDGSPICVQVAIDAEQGSAVFDFAGTGPEVYGNCNAPRAVTYSAVIYCLRCMVGHDIPLNQGCLNPVDIKIPKGSLLYPSDEAAVVGGNVLTSQRVVDVILRAFEACGASQGCMANTTFGTEQSAEGGAAGSAFGYYETVAGGAGAGPTWDGRSGVHTHMTNTRITDPEVLERRYPVVLERFSLRRGSGGAGRHRGGDGVERQIRFRRPLKLSILTERRAHRPYGMAGGQPGQAGLNLLIKADGRTINLGSKATVHVQAGDRFRLLTPGGGGYGEEV